MRRRRFEESRELHLLDQYLSLRAGDVFEDVAVAAGPLETPAASPTGRRRSTVIALAASAAFALAMLGQAGSGGVAISSLRGAPAQLEGVSTWRDSGELELAWSSVPEASHYTLQVWDSHGGLVASLVVESPETLAAVGVRPDAPLPLLWMVVAWDDTRRLSGSEVLTSTPAQ